MSFVVKKGKEVVLKCGHEDFPDKKDIGKPHAMIVTEGTVEKLKQILEVAAAWEHLSFEEFKKALPHCPPC